MPRWQIAIVTVYGVIAVAAVLRAILVRSTRHLLAIVTPNDPGVTSSAPMVSIMVPARNEEETIEVCVRSLLAQRYPNFELLVVDDRSEDRTAEIVRGIATQDSRLRLVQVETLPEGWTGKTHALHLCRRRATGDWLLYVDADTRLHPDALSILLRHALDQKIGLLSLIGGLDTRSFWEKTVQPFAGLFLMVLYPLPMVNDPKRLDMGFANGQFILMSKEMHAAIGGHESVRDKFVEDIHLGRKARQSGLGLRVVNAKDLVTVRMYSSLDQIIRGWSRIFYSSVDTRPGKLWMLLALLVIFSMTSWLTLAVFGGLTLAGKTCIFTWTMLGLALAHEVGQTFAMAELYRHTNADLRYLALRPVAAAVLVVILLRTIRMCRTHEVSWRGTTYGKTIQTGFAAADRLVGDAVSSAVDPGAGTQPSGAADARPSGPMEPTRHGGPS